jgi:rubrerythrin
LATVQQSFERLISLAIQREEEAYQFYTDASDTAELSSSSKLLQELAQQEVGHKEKLQGALKEGVCDTFTCETVEEVEDMKLGKYLLDIPLEKESSPQDILIVAIKREEAAFSFYKALSELTGNASHRTVFETLAREEEGHKIRLENMYDDIFQPDM